MTYGETFHQQISGTAAASKRQIDRLALNNVQTSTHDLRVYFAHWGLNVDQNELDGSATPIEYQEGTTNETITTP
ncbi:hypothetical protein [Andreprevotia chitinilytica]|uniref:hypothetical protein n=1 Tax=Andreprevotia chitinilytica TaxID=396808 RepID=UPI0012EBF11D|nr:hypothetical protein [Andreprevotia chitinilytica]